jgi:hypothetical protein
MNAYEGMPPKGDESVNKPAGAERVIELAEHVLTETAFENEIAELESLMVDEPELRRVYLRYTLLHGQLALTNLPEPKPMPLPMPRVSEFWSHWLPWCIAATACLVAVASWSRPQTTVSEKSISGNVQTESSEVMALLVDEAGSVFARPRTPGEVRFYPGEYELLAGTVHLRYVNGVDFVVEGPARFEIRDALRIQLHAGRVRAIVPPSAHGFTVLTRGVAYEDIGTEFGLSVDGSTGESQMHVFDGQVNLRRGNADGLLLQNVFGGDSVGFRGGQVVEISDMDVGEFPLPGEIGHLRWDAQRKARLADSGLIAWFPFDADPNQSLLVNEVRGHGVSDGRIVGARWGTGRWQGKRALWFDRESDYVEIEIPGKYTEMTVAAWLKVDRFDQEMNAILDSDGVYDGGYHLQMDRQGLPRGGLLGVERPSERWVGPPVPEGKWVHVVSVLSLLRRSHVIYVNGVAVLEQHLADADVQLQPGQCRLGNWLSDGKPYRTSRAFRGLVDELSIWNRALSASEVLALTESGRPSQLWSRENPPIKAPIQSL